MAQVTPLLAQVVQTLGTSAAARLLEADRAQDLDDILTRILHIYSRDAAAMWLVGSEPLLGGARPIDVLVMESAGPVLRAIEGIAAGAYA
jgi:uncharacterized protein (DUF2384 family)